MPAMLVLELTANQRVICQFSNGIAVCYWIYVHAVFRQWIITPDAGDMPKQAS